MSAIAVIEAPLLMCRVIGDEVLRRRRAVRAARHGRGPRHRPAIARQMVIGPADGDVGARLVRALCSSPEAIISASTMAVVCSASSSSSE